MPHGWLEMPTPCCGYCLASLLSPSLAYATVLPGSSRARRRQAHCLTQQHLSRSSGDWPRRRSCWPLADPSPAQSAPAPRAWPSAPAPHACSPAWKVCFLVSSDPREKFKETQLGPSWATSSALNQNALFCFPPVSTTCQMAPSSLTKGLSPDMCQSFPEISQALLWLILLCAKAYTNYMPKYTPHFQEIPP